MKKTNLSNAACVILNSPQNHIKKSMFHQFMKKNRPFGCSKCSSKFTRRRSLKIHIGSIHERKKPFACNICDSKFSQKGFLTKHSKTVHECKKPFGCNICDVKFRKRSTLTQHIEGHKPFGCSVCDAKFREKRKLTQHTSSVHEGKRSLLDANYVMLSLQKKGL